MAKVFTDWELVGADMNNPGEWLKRPIMKQTFQAIKGLEVTCYWQVKATNNPQRIIINGDEIDVTDIHFEFCNDFKKWLSRERVDDLCMKYLGHLV